MMMDEEEASARCHARESSRILYPRCSYDLEVCSTSIWILQWFTLAGAS